MYACTYVTYVETSTCTHRPDKRQRTWTIKWHMGLTMGGRSGCIYVLVVSEEVREENGIWINECIVVPALRMLKLPRRRSEICSPSS